MKRLLSNDELPLPSELDWDRMQDGIMNKMEAIEVESAVPTKRSGKTAYRIIALLGLLLLPMICSRQIRDARMSSSHLSLPWGLSFGYHTEKKTEKKTEKTATPAKQPEPTQKASERVTMTRPAKTVWNPSGVGPQKTTEPALSVLDKADATQTSDIFGFALTRSSLSVADKTDGVTVQSDNKELSSSEKIPDDTLQVQVWTIPVLPTQLFAPVYEPAEAVWTPAAPNRSKAQQSGQLSASTGIAFWSPGYGKIKPVRYEYEKSGLSYLTNLTYTHPLKKGYHFSVGLQYVQLESRFNWNTTLDNYKVVLKDTVVQIQTNIVTGEQTKVYGDVELTVEAERIVQHYNTTRLVQVPFAFGKTFSRKKWSSDLSLGGALNIFASNKGRSMAIIGDVIDFDGGRTTLVDNQWKAHAFVSSRIHYLISERMAVNAGIMYQRSLSDWSRIEGITMQPNILSLNMGLSYRLFDRK